MMEEYNWEKVDETIESTQLLEAACNSHDLQRAPREFHSSLVGSEGFAHESSPSALSNFHESLPSRSSPEGRERSSSVSVSTDSITTALRGATSFPAKLHQVLQQAEMEGFQSIISWCDVKKIEGGMGAGCSPFKVHDPQKFVEKIAPQHFPSMGKYKSFLRQLNLWGFSRIRSREDAAINGCYYHLNFVRERPFLCLQMKRTKIKGLYVRNNKDSHNDLLSKLATGNTGRNVDSHEPSSLQLEDSRRYHHDLRVDGMPQQKEASMKMMGAIPPSTMLPSYEDTWLPMPLANPSSEVLPYRVPLPESPLLQSASARMESSNGSTASLSASLGGTVATKQDNFGDMSENDLKYVMLGIQIGQLQFGHNSGPQQDRNSGTPRQKRDDPEDFYDF